MPKYKWYQGKVVDIIDETHNIKRFFIQIPSLKNYEFKAGQFTILDLPIGPKANTRMYSIASAPNSGNIIELIIVLNPEGKGTPYLFEQVKAGSDIRLSSAIGKFVLPEVIDRDICFICTGVGIAPFRSMYHEIYNLNIPHKNLYMVFGTRHETDLCYKEELRAMEKSHDSFHYIPTLSRETSEKWKGKKGYVHEAYKEIFQDRRPAMFYICGWKTMIFEAKNNLLEMGYQADDVKYELYD